jgi:hypothetical protein
MIETALTYTNMCHIFINFDQKNKFVFVNGYNVCVNALTQLEQNVKRVEL